MKKPVKTISYAVFIATLIVAVQLPVALAQDSGGSSNNATAPFGWLRANHDTQPIPLTGGPHIYLAPFSFPATHTGESVHSSDGNRCGPPGPEGFGRSWEDLSSKETDDPGDNDAVGPFGLPGQNGSGMQHPEVQVTEANLIEALYGADTFHIFLYALERTYLAKTLEMPGPYTVFAPTDQAFGQLPPSVLRDLLENPESLLALVEILSNHIVNASIQTQHMTRLDAIQSLGGHMLEIGQTRRTFTVGEASVVLSNVIASNGVLHGIDTVLLPKYPPHIDPVSVFDVPVEAPGRPREYVDVLGIMERTGDFDVFLGALQATGLDEMLRGVGPFTIFAPTDKAFEEMPAVTQGYMVIPKNAPSLSDILLYHIVSGRLWTGDLGTKGSAQSLLGPSLDFTSRDRGLWVNDARIVKGNLTAANGVVHGINKLLFP